VVSAKWEQKNRHRLPGWAARIRNILKTTSKLNKIEHIGIAVKDLEASNILFEKLMGTASYKTEEVASEGVRTSFFRMGESKVELLEAMDGDSPISKFLEQRGEGVHHIAFAVDDIALEIKRLKSEGFMVLNDKPKRGGDNKLVAFFHPKSTNGVLVELCQECPPQSVAEQ
jgi:methylmalonyl-CoA/ethylmalonyl-CoA epimerase